MNAYSRIQIYFFVSMHNEVREDHTCAICLTVYYEPVTLKKCTHVFCQYCIEETAN